MRSEQDRLALFTAFGATELSQTMFRRAGEPFRAGWEELGSELEQLVDQAEMAGLARATQYAHYTPECVFRRCRPLIPERCRPPFRFEVAHDFRLMSPGLWLSGPGLSLPLFRLPGQAFWRRPARFLRMLSPVRSMRVALWTRRSRMASA